MRQLTLAVAISAIFGSGAGLLSPPCVPFRLRLLARRHSAQLLQPLGEAIEADRFGPVLPGIWRPLAGLAPCTDHCPTGDGHGLACRKGFRLFWSWKSRHGRRRAIETIGAVLAGSERPFIVTSGTALAAPGRVATEEDAADSNIPRKSEEAAASSAAAGGARVSVLRLPPSVHGVGDHGFVPMLIRIARDKGASAYVGEGHNRWPAVHRLDAAHRYSLVIEKHAVAQRYHAVADEGVAFREIAEVIGRRLKIPVISKSPEEAADHFSWFAHFVGLDCPASSARTGTSRMASDAEFADSRH